MTGIQPTPGDHAMVKCVRLASLCFGLLVAACSLWANVRARPTEEWLDLKRYVALYPKVREVCSPDAHFRFGWPLLALETGQVYYYDQTTKWHQWEISGAILDLIVGAAAVAAAVAVFEFAVARPLIRRRGAGKSGSDARI